MENSQNYRKKKKVYNVATYPYHNSVFFFLVCLQIVSVFLRIRVMEIPSFFFFILTLNMLTLVLVTQSCDPMDCSPPGSSVHEILQAGILEWAEISFSRGSSPPSD